MVPNGNVPPNVTVVLTCAIGFDMQKWKVSGRAGREAQWLFCGLRRTYQGCEVCYKLVLITGNTRQSSAQCSSKCLHIIRVLLVLTRTSHLLTESTLYDLYFIFVEDVLTFSPLSEVLAHCKLFGIEANKTHKWWCFQFLPTYWSDYWKLSTILSMFYMSVIM